MKASIVLSVVAVGLTIGCAQPKKHTVSMVTTTQPADRDGGAAPHGQHVELMVRDATSSGLAGSIVGRPCRVQFRRDALGMSSATGVGPTDNYRGMTSITGTIETLNDQWVVVSNQGRRYVIPHDAILLIDVQE
jgi:hypothetical protein